MVDVQLLRCSPALLLSFGLLACEGSSGSAGAPGPVGNDGASGPTGRAGPPGPMGTEGPMGVPGPFGRTGAPGPTGPTGAAGPAGPAGADGAAGPVGPAGPPGGPAPRSAVIPSYLDVHGRSLEEWAGEWWRWLAAIPSDSSPLYDQDGAHCQVGQSGPVFFLAGTVPTTSSGTVSVGQVQRECEVPFGRPVLIPLINQLTVADEIGVAAVDDALREAAQQRGEPVSGLWLEVDGVVQDVLFVPTTAGPLLLEFPDDSIFEANGALPAGTLRAADHGYYVMLEPLPPGTHEVHFGGQLDQQAAVHGQDATFIQTVEYQLKVLAP
jgi:hypothetical protein